MMALKDSIDNVAVTNPLPKEAMDWLTAFNKESGAEKAPDFYHAIIDGDELEIPNL